MNFPFQIIYEATMKLLPTAMDTPKAKAMMYAIGMQEGDKFTVRRQYNDGPARGFWQFEQGGGVRGVLTHAATKHHAKAILDQLQYNDYPTTVWNALEHNDILAMAFARLNLWWAAGALPEPGDYDGSWAYYINTWRPGKPHRSTWNGYYDLAWQNV